MAVETESQLVVAEKLDILLVDKEVGGRQFWDINFDEPKKPTNKDTINR